MRLFCATFSFWDMVDFVLVDFNIKGQIHQNRPYTNSTISQEEKFAQKKICFIALRIFSVNLNAYFLVGNTRTWLKNVTSDTREPVGWGIQSKSIGGLRTEFKDGECGSPNPKKSLNFHTKLTISKKNYKSEKSKN